MQVHYEGCARSKYAVQFDIKLLQKLFSIFLSYVSNCVDERRLTPSASSILILHAIISLGFCVHDYNIYLSSLFYNWLTAKNWYVPKSLTTVFITLILQQLPISTGTRTARSRNILRNLEAFQIKLLYNVTRIWETAIFNKNKFRLNVCCWSAKKPSRKS